GGGAEAERDPGGDDHNARPRPRNARGSLLPAPRPSPSPPHARTNSAGSVLSRTRARFTISPWHPTPSRRLRHAVAWSRDRRAEWAAGLRLAAKSPGSAGNGPTNQVPFSRFFHGKAAT